VECWGRAAGQSVTFSGPQTATEVDGRILGAFRTSLELFLHAVRTGEEPPTSGARTLHVTEAQVGILESIARGEAVDLERTGPGPGPGPKNPAEPAV
jgi:predicted dehydrogenase